MSESTHHDPPADTQEDLFADGAFEEEIGGGEIPDSVGIIGDGIEAKIVEYAPGQSAVILGRENIPRYGVVLMERTAKNEYRPRFVGWGKKIALRKFFRPGASGSEPHPVLQCLGLDLSYNSVLRLYKNGFIRGTMPVPHRILIDIASLNRHLEEASDPDFWTEERVRQFKETIY